MRNGSDVLASAVCMAVWLAAVALTIVAFTSKPKQ